MRLVQTNSVFQTQARIGIARPRLYTLEEASDELKHSVQTLKRLISKFGIRPPFITKGSKRQYKLADFQEALNKECQTSFKIDKGIPLPPRFTPAESKFSGVFGALEVGDSTLMSDDDCVAFYNYVKRKDPTRKYASRKDPEEFGMKRVWRLI